MTEWDHETLQRRVEAEIVELHDFIAGWFRGELPRDAALFASMFADRLAPDFLNIQPNGGELGREALLKGLEQGHGRNPDFRITISRVCLLSAGNAGLTVRYVEDQQGARNTQPADNRRISTAVMDQANGRFLWRHLQETAQPFPG